MPKITPSPGATASATAATWAAVSAEFEIASGCYVELCRTIAIDEGDTIAGRVRDDGTPTDNTPDTSTHAQVRVVRQKYACIATNSQTSSASRRKVSLEQQVCSNVVQVSIAVQPLELSISTNTTCLQVTANADDVGVAADMAHDDVTLHIAHFTITADITNL